MTESRRAFVERLVQAGFGAAAASALVGFSPRDADDKRMYGPVRQAHEVLQLPPATWARDLVAPYGDGRPMSDQWAIAYIAQGRRGQLIIVMVDLQTGGHAEVEVWARTPGSRARAGTRLYDLHLRGQQEGPRHLLAAADKLAGHIGRHERRVQPPHALPRRPQDSQGSAA